MQYKIIKNFISEQEIDILLKNIHLHIDEFSPGVQCKGTFQIHNFLPSVYLLVTKTKEISEIVGESVLPTFAYTRIYKKDTELTPHTDRPACEIVVSVHLYGDKPWDLIVEEDGEEKAISLNVGDAAIYRGHKNKHWRDSKYQGNNYISIFLSYVRMNGEFSNLYFDRV